MRRVHIAIVLLGLAMSAVGLWLTFTSDHEDDPAFVAAANLLVAWAFIGTGIVAWIRRPDNRFGVLMTAVGLASFFGALNEADESLPYTLGIVLGLLGYGVFVHAMLAFPRGYLETRLVWAAVATAYAVTLAAPALYSMFEPETCTGCPDSLLFVTDSSGGRFAVQAAALAAGVFVVCAAVLVLTRRWRAASTPLRRVLAPVFATTAISLILIGLALLVSLASSGAARILFWLVLFAFASVPLAFLAGLLRTRLVRVGMSQLMVELGQARAPGHLRDALRRALGDPTLRVAYWLPERETFVDARGRPVDLPAPDDDLYAATRVERGGRCIGALIHDRALLEDPTVVDAAVAAAGLALENERRLIALEQEEARHRALLEAIPDLMFRLSADGTYLDFSGDANALIVPPDRLLGSKLHDVLQREVADTILNYVRDVIGGRRVPPIEYALELADGPREFEARASVSGDNEVVLIVRDVTGVKRLHAELAERNEALERERDFIRTVVDAAPSFFCLVDPGGRIVRFNSTLEAASGRSDDESTRTQPFWDVFIAAEERDAVQREFRELVACGCSGEYENAWLTADERRLTVAWSMTPLTDELGSPRFLVSGIDVTERERQAAELRRSRARLVEIGDVERRRLERNLHDGAQQRLVSLSLVLRLVQAKVEDDPAEAKRLLKTAADELSQALEELRELARGIHPAILSDRGLPAALEALASRSTLPIDVRAPEERLPAQVEAAAYYVVSEALANIAKYANASTIEISVSRNNGRAVVEVADDGVGGADPTTGSGLRGLVDRIEALDGWLSVESPPGAGTRIRAEIPCA